jgi:hypothetical protein
MKSFEKITKKVYEPIWVHLGFSTYSKEFKAIRDEMTYTCSSCIKCNHKFKDNESIALACFKGIGNKVLCETCAKEISE